MALPAGSPRVMWTTDTLLTVGDNGFVKDFSSRWLSFFVLLLVCLLFWLAEVGLDQEAPIQRQCQVVAGDLQWQVVENLLVWRFNSLPWDGNLLLHWKNLERKTWARAEISPGSKCAVLWHQSAKGCHSVQSFRPRCATHTVGGLGGHCKVGDPEHTPSGSWGHYDGCKIGC